ncbi:MAG TPA: hypothetical protein VIL30_05020, partial [Ramlibacter sp.]
DWANATWIWESVLQSRPNVVAIRTNAARGRSSMGQPQAALAHLEQARRIQPQAPAVRSLEVVLLARNGEDAKALAAAKDALANGIHDYDLLNAAFILAWRAGDIPLALRTLQQRMREFPQTQAGGQVQLGLLYLNELKDPAKALDAFRAGVALAATPAERAALLQQLPQPYREQLSQMSSSSR